MVHLLLTKFVWNLSLGIYHCFIGYQRCINSRMVQDLLICSMKPLSKLLTTSLSMISCHFRQYCSGIYCRTGVNCFWIIDNSQQVLSALSKINYFSTAKHFDFSNLYTSIPHTSLKEALTSLIKEAYRVRDNHC